MIFVYIAFEWPHVSSLVIHLIFLDREFFGAHYDYASYF